MRNKWKSIIAIVLSISFFNAPLTAALAEVGMEGAYTPITTVSSDTTEVSADENGIVRWRDKSEDTWHSSDLQYLKNGVSNLYVFDNTFVATSFFNIATSTDGKTWNKQYIQAGKKFDPENLISDEEFFVSNKMSVEDIQKFLEKNTDCKNNNCLAKYKQKTKALNGEGLCSNYPASGYHSAAQIIFNSSKFCNISAEVILTTLQKEQGLITNNAPSSGELKIAMGYACPDTADCNKNFFGFQQQIYNGSKQFQAYRTDATFNWIPVNKSSEIDYHPDSDKCGSSNLTIRNEATAGLYYYTPYQPNASALKNIFGTGDDCGAYGNRNFWRIYNQWFNDTRDYEVFVLKIEDTFYAYDGTGSILRTKSLNSEWEYLKAIPLPEDIRILSLYEQGGTFKATTNRLGMSLLSKDGLTWELKQEVSMTADEKISLSTLEPANLSIVTNQMELSGKLIVSVNGSIHDEVIINESNFNMGVIRLPSFILNDGTHDIHIKLSEGGKFISNDINIKANVGTPKETIYHRVRMGETLESIASQYETTPAWIREANGLNANEPIERSMKLKVKYIYNSNMLSTSPIYEQYHVVLPGQGLAKIASINEVTVSQIKKLNNIKEEEIYVGQRIRIA